MTLDPDFGWHLQFGRLVLHTHMIPIRDTYSYTMPSFHFINHEWGSDIIIASLYDKWGMWPLSILFALISVSTLYFLTKGVNAKWAALPLFLIGGTVIDFTGIRPQMFTWVFTALVISLLWQKKIWQKWRFFIPLLFLIWANIHGGFFIGIVIVGWFIFGGTIESRRLDRKDCGVFLLSLLATLCNPYGYHLWIEVLLTITDQGLHWGIEEWNPAIAFTNIAFWLYIAISFSLIIRYRRHFSYKILGLYALLFLSGMSSMRNIPVFAVVSFYPTVLATEYFYKEAGTYLYGKERFMRAYIGFVIICVAFFLPQVGIFVYSFIIDSNGPSSYPEGAVTYIRNHLPPGNVFSSYDWGGYLIWQLPEKKVFIDGRMPTWKNSTAPLNESTYAFGDYEKLLNSKISFAEVSKKYNIDAVLASTNDLHQQHLILFGKDVDNSWLLKPFSSQNWSFALIIAQVKKMGWKEVYHDNTAVVFERK